MLEIERHVGDSQVQQVSRIQRIASHWTLLSVKIHG